MRTINLPTLIYTDLTCLVDALWVYEEKIKGKEDVFIEWEVLIGDGQYILNVRLSK